ncbi:hypothetical protein HI914_04052 [Erysiphe necator]|nr:hypothetical protein HI914_04052 [Erysiphe necator]
MYLMAPPIIRTVVTTTYYRCANSLKQEIHIENWNNFSATLVFSLQQSTQNTKPLKSTLLKIIKVYLTIFNLSVSHIIFCNNLQPQPTIFHDNQPEDDGLQWIP